MGAAFVHEGAGHDHVVHEMADEKPVVGVDVRFGPDQAQTIAAALGVKFKDAVDQAHAAIGQMQSGRQADAGEPSAETAGQVAAAQGVHLVIRIGFPGHGHRRLPIHRTFAGDGLCAPVR